MAAADQAPPGIALRRTALKSGLTLALALAFAAGGVSEAWARKGEAAADSVALACLPPEAQATYRLIHAGGPFPFQKDGVVFGNRERHLPPKARGYYREYTVTTPGASDRGARRIVCGGTPPTSPQGCYYTADHYASFSRITP